MPISEGDNQMKATEVYAKTPSSENMGKGSEDPVILLKVPTMTSSGVDKFDYDR